MHDPTVGSRQRKLGKAAREAAKEHRRRDYASSSNFERILYESRWRDTPLTSSLTVHRYVRHVPLATPEIFVASESFTNLWLHLQRRNYKLLVG
jgi:hypothetical protein